MIGILGEDCGAFDFELGAAGDTPTNRRAYIRAVFALIEALVFTSKQAILRDRMNYSDAEMAMLREETYNVSKGAAFSQMKFIPIEENFRFMLAMMNRRAKEEHKESFDGAGWQAFKQATKIRHRLTHPKQRTDLDVTDTEIEIFHTTFSWVFSCFMRGIVSLFGRDDKDSIELSRQMQSILDKRTE